ncbi:glycosyltransferase family 52 protein [Shewanella abyssi]|uniref:glycosyltransferase family 52 n=1 Tax=Shewanella abyssi TaxID=311789 RepID=UPI00200E7362|nr:glycosyltransferase family 52 [Shewanella abyssi]MCL1049766.1 glycosyltransferase family 52 protein [Shewanella abyssi]
MNVLESVGVRTDNILVFESTYYSLFLYLLCDDAWRGRDFLIFGDRISIESLERLKKYANVLDESYLYMPRPMPTMLKNPFNYVARKIAQKKLFAMYEYCIGHARQINNWLVETKRIQIEDGTATHYELTHGDKKRGLFDIISLKEPQKVDRIDKFIVAKDLKPLEQFEGKVVTIDFFQLWKHKSPEQKNEILDVFDVDASQFNLINQGCSVLFTQPLSEINDYAEVKKINGYKKLVQELLIEESDLVIKPHPREVTDYKLHFPGAIILKASFPCELMPLLNVRVDKVISLSSTAGSCFLGFCNEIIYAKAPTYFDMPQKLQDSINKFDL